MKQKWIIVGIGIFLLGITLGVFYLTQSSAKENEQAQQEVSPPSAQKDQPVEQPIEALIFVT